MCSRGFIRRDSTITRQVLNIIVRSKQNHKDVFVGVLVYTEIRSRLYKDRLTAVTVLIFFGAGADGSQTARTLSPGDEDEKIMRASREVRGVMNLFLCSLRDSGVCRASSPRQFISAENKPLSCGDRDRTQTTTKTRQNKRTAPRN
ncbi:hypothetical protein DPX16_2839 [Anabarilius grahami]|uniref:Uncharacterized protein n=1 Tax=Anabarilius grahami TaxID=495550 RepID=A0A3N0YWU3_ANAGA|nr:hypothetical protein DPX16_2839 [Anabarilius grahami]